MALKRTKVLVGVLGVLAACTSGGSGSSDEPGAPGPLLEDRISIRVEGGGQTGGEGGCDSEPEGPITFNGQEVLALVAGRHETTLAYRPSWQTVNEAGEQGKRMIVEVSARGEPETVKGCSWVIALPVEVKISLDQPALDVIIEHTLIGYSADVAELSFALPAGVAEQLGLEEARTVLPWNGMEPPAYFSMWFGADGVRGEVRGGANCGSLVFPAGRSCVHAGGFPTEENAVLRAALATFEALPALPVTLSDGTSTTLAVEPQGDPLQLCGKPHPLSYARRARLAARLRSADERIDVLVEGELIVDGATNYFTANGFLPAESAQAIPYFSDVNERELALLNLVVLFLDSSAPQARLQLSTVSATATGRMISKPLWVSEGSGQGPTCFDASMATSAGAERD
jgi:hypothetical protein